MFRRRRFAARRRFRPRRVTPRRYFRARKSLKIARRFVHNFVRTDKLNNLTTDGITDYTVGLNDITGNTEFAVLYRYFMIRAIKYTFYAYRTNADVGGTGVQVPRITTVINRDGATLSTESDLLQMPSARTTTLDNGRKHVVYIKKPTFDSTTFVSKPNSFWVPCYSSGTTVNTLSFRGMTVSVAGLTTDSNQIAIYRKVYLQCKQPW